MTEHRRDPDALLARAKEEEARKRQGRLKLFFGAAAGVGKTYAMLEAARELQADGRNVLVGVVETHGRAETAALLEGLPVLPPRLVEYRGATLKEFDLDGALSRRPTAILVDELAHTNAEGSRHRKRWQDVLELLDAGITVYTTLNVQHVESLNDVVAKITGVVVRETVPDSVLERADEIELVDLPPDDLLERLQEGKVYIPTQAQEAIENFFRKGNLIALRELALRRTAERVDAQMQAYMRDHAIAKTWPVAERILVCVGPSPFSPQLVRAGHRLAHRLGAQLIVAYVETAAHARLSQADQDRIIQTLRLAESLGAETVRLSGPTMSEEILAYARGRNVSKIVIGKPARSLWQRILLGSIVDALVRGSGEIDIHVVSGEGEPASGRPLRPRPHVPNWASYGLALAAVAVSTGIACAMFGHFGLSNLIMVYLLGVVAVAARTSRGPTVVASVLSVLAFDFFFVPPYLSFAVSDTEHLLTFFVMLVVALVTSGMTVRIRAQAAAARQRERRIGALYSMSRELASGRGVDTLLETALRHISEVFAGQITVLLPDAAGHMAPRLSKPEGVELSGTDLGVAQWTYEHREVAGLGTSTVPGARVLCVPLLASRGAVGVLAVVPPEPHAFDNPEALHQLETFANQTALAIERAQLAEEAQAAELRAETERMRNSLLSSVSHDLRTPLATIIGASSGLLEGGERLAAPTRRDLVRSIHGEATQLDRLVNELLEMTRLESGAVTIKAEPQALDGIVGSALHRLDQLLRDRVVRVILPPDLPLVRIDALLMEQVFINLLDNAARYSPPGSPIEVAASVAGLKVVVEVSDRGQGFAPGEEARAFEKFYRGRSPSTRGVGLGLAICRAIVEVHGGTITAENRPGDGATIRFTLPREESPSLPDPTAVVDAC
ncbi:MAG TPA: sensor histidine kinase KdpD [Methylomirabilota bacterium]|nr:sensor histidine kinase KdpD [Methylomirabilota bacterium]